MVWKKLTHQDDSIKAEEHDTQHWREINSLRRTITKLVPYFRSLDSTRSEGGHWNPRETISHIEDHHPDILEEMKKNYSYLIMAEGRTLFKNPRMAFYFLEDYLRAHEKQHNAALNGDTSYSIDHHHGSSSADAEELDLTKQQIKELEDHRESPEIAEKRVAEFWDDMAED